MEKHSTNSRFAEHYPNIDIDSLSYEEYVNMKIDIGLKDSVEGNSISFDELKRIFNR